MQLRNKAPMVFVRDFIEGAGAAAPCAPCQRQYCFSIFELNLVKYIFQSV